MSKSLSVPDRFLERETGFLDRAATGDLTESKSIESTDSTYRTICFIDPVLLLVRGGIQNLRIEFPCHKFYGNAA